MRLCRPPGGAESGPLCYASGVLWEIWSPHLFSQLQFSFVCESVTASSWEAQIQSHNQLLLLNEFSFPWSYLCPVVISSSDAGTFARLGRSPLQLKSSKQLPVSFFSPSLLWISHKERQLIKHARCFWMGVGGRMSPLHPRVTLQPPSCWR